MKYPMSLVNLSPGESAAVKEILCGGGMKRRLLDLGLTQGTVIKCVGKSPMGDPLAFSIRGAVIAIRKEDCRNILIK